jgi:hypothetical protein
MTVSEAIKRYDFVTGQKWLRIIFGQMLIRSKICGLTTDALEMYSPESHEWFTLELCDHSLLWDSECNLIDPIPELKKAPVVEEPKNERRRNRR